jgi:hypothetical protein
MPTRASEREKRRAKALRENLRRRKQASVASVGNDPGVPEADHKKSPDGPNNAQKPR